ncbi:nucleotidyltransferase domain-containing protein [Roseofilum reptotaenium CS-1145]|uniref:Nucleotidyltransferase n=2 Tax=Roseofilum TaxID=1233426 RepID=A0A1L9QNA6_9CYAN|nr:nucleotidyltransferase domain-containing protein [Roseofilum reptotaenium]MBP0030097.1 nucleotidyltransferase domain-containing protein [Roseofilum sp. Guam]MDB9515722.1 nucleotidyltransferase domain-containing protein [Roseofilum reptotaenium CS-1145]OJJ24067.1 nucleotidyltransferase [Roseofilum reptotaenium AO1-A]
MNPISSPICKHVHWPEEQIQTFCQQWSVTELSLFGSILREEDFHRDSDIDLLIAFSADADWSLFDHIQMQQELEALFNRKVDLISKRAVLRSHNPIRRQEILSTAQVVYSQESYGR